MSAAPGRIFGLRSSPGTLYHRDACGHEGRPDDWSASQASFFFEDFFLGDGLASVDVPGVEAMPIPQPNVTNAGYGNHTPDAAKITPQIAQTTRLIRM